MGQTIRNPQLRRLSKQEQIERAYQQKAVRERRDAIIENNGRFDQLFLAFKQKESK